MSSHIDPHPDPDREISDAAETCCTDVFRNWRDAYLLKPQSRPCTEAEKSKISLRKVIAKQIVSTSLVALVAWFILIQTESASEQRGTLFNCDPNDPDSINVIDGVVTDFNDEGRQYCYFKSTMIIVSFIFLVPFFLESVSIVTIIWISSINDEVLIPICDSQYCGYDSIYDGVLEANFFKRMLAASLVFFQVPNFVYSVASDSEETNNFKTKLMLLFELLWKFSCFMLPDLLLAISLFPVSYFVMQSSNSPDEIIINLVAVQVFAQLDEVFVKMLLRPRASVGESIQNYLNYNPKSEVGKYSPLEAYKLTVNRHEWGVKVKGMAQMKEFHEYSGFHFAP